MIQFDFDLGETANSVRDMVQQFASASIAPRAAEIDHANTFPRDLWPELGRLGLLGITASPNYGGAGMGYTEHVVVLEEISRASAWSSRIALFPKKMSWGRSTTAYASS